jgi:hypothetical protein
VVIVESVGAAFLVLGSFLILRACWRLDQPEHPAPRRLTRVRIVRTAAVDKRAA